jgi:hypothetical protein
MSNATDTIANNRWWENYLVRYLIGTLFGCVCICLILVAQLYVQSPQHLTKNGMADFLNLHRENLHIFSFILVLSGIFYCYFSSTPITVFHAVRHDPPNYFITPVHIWLGWPFAIILSAIISSLMKSVIPMLVAFSIPAIFCFITQYKAVDHIYRRKKPFIEGYQKLARRRSDNKNLALVRDYRDSYSHLREHSNSVFIVLCEFSLTSLLVLPILWFRFDAFTTTLWLLSVMAVWLTPNVLLWRYANDLEADFP